MKEEISSFCILSKETDANSPWNRAREKLRNIWRWANDRPILNQLCGGDRMWTYLGRLHREDGPAIERADGSIEWWTKDRKIASFTAQQVADYTEACAENRQFDEVRAGEKSVADLTQCLTQGLAQPVSIRRPIQFRRGGISA